MRTTPPFTLHSAMKRLLKLSFVLGVVHFRQPAHPLIENLQRIVMAMQQPRTF